MIKARGRGALDGHHFDHFAARRCFLSHVERDRDRGRLRAARLVLGAVGFMLSPLLRAICVGVPANQSPLSLLKEYEHSRVNSPSVAEKVIRSLVSGLGNISASPSFCTFPFGFRTSFPKLWLNGKLPQPHRY